MPTTPTSALIERVEAHIRAVHAEIQELLTYACNGGVVPSPYAQKQGDVDVPSCAALRERGSGEGFVALCAGLMAMCAAGAVAFWVLAFRRGKG